MAIARVPNCGYETPLTENPIDFSEFVEVDNTLRTRRMSETNLAGPQLYNRPSVTTPGPPSVEFCFSNSNYFCLRVHVVVVGRARLTPLTSILKLKEIILMTVGLQYKF